jgi:hypothetical protein
MGKAKGSDKGGKPTDARTPEENLMALLESEDTPPQDPPPTPDADEEELEDGDTDSDEDDDDDDNEDADEDSSDDDDDDDDGDEDADDDDTEQYTFEVVVNGEKKTVDAEELVKGYQLQSDYSRKTAALAEERNAFTEEQQAVQAERTRYAGLLDKMEAALESTMPKPEDLEKLRSSNPGEYAARKADLQEHQNKLQQVKAEKQAVYEKQMEDDFKAYQKYVGEERVKLHEVLPEWKDPAVAKKEQDAIVTYAKSMGFTEQEISQVADHRNILMLRKAMQFDKLQGKKPLVRKKTKRVPVLKPGAKKPAKRKTKEAQRTREKLTKTGSVLDAADVMLGLLDTE